MPTINDYHVDPVLTNLSVAWTNEEYINKELFPRLVVPKKQGIYYQFDKAGLRVEDAKRTGQSRAARVDYNLTKKSYGPLTERALEEPIEWDIRDTYPSPMSAMTDATMNVTEKLEVSEEKELADILLDTAQVTQNTTLSGTSQWSDFANSDPRGDIQTGMDTVQGAAIRQPNVLAMGYQVFAKLRLHPDLLGSLASTTIKVLTVELLASLLGVDEVLVGKAMYNSAVEGQTDALGYIWGKNAILMYRTKTPGIKQITAGYNLVLEGGRYVDTWGEQAVKSDFVRVNDYMQYKVVATEAMYLIKNAVA